MAAACDPRGDGYWEPDGSRSPQQALAKGDFKFTLEGERLHGSFVLVRMRNDRDGGKRTRWLLIKQHDDYSVEENGAAVLEENATSVASAGRWKRSPPARVRSQNRSWLKVRRAGGCGLGQQQKALLPKNARQTPKPERSRRRAKVARSAMPDFVAPQLCETRERPPSADGWIHQIKFDGYRIQMRIENGEVTLKTRKGLDWTGKYPAIASSASNLPDAIIAYNEQPIVDHFRGIDANRIMGAMVIEGDARIDFFELERVRSSWRVYR